MYFMHTVVTYNYYANSKGKMYIQIGTKEYIWMVMKHNFNNVVLIILWQSTYYVIYRWQNCLFKLTTLIYFDYRIFLKINYLFYKFFYKKFSFQIQRSLAYIYTTLSFQVNWHIIYPWKYGITPHCLLS